MLGILELRVLSFIRVLSSRRTKLIEFFLKGISMELVERRGEETYFDIEHGRAYREVQKMFLDAVESADPSNITVSRRNIST